MKLAKCPVRVKARIIDVEVDSRFNLRLQELGVRTGAEFTVVNRAAFGGRVINIAGTRIAVDHRSSQVIEVIPVSDLEAALASDADKTKALPSVYLSPTQHSCSPLESQGKSVDAVATGEGRAR